MTEQQARIEIVSRSLQLHRVTPWRAAQWPGLARVEMESELLRRGIPLYEATAEQLNAELDAMHRLGIPG